MLLGRAPTVLMAVMLFGAFAAEPRAARADASGPSSAPAASAEAEPATPEVAEAREVFRLGVEFARKGKWEDALAAFERSNRLRPHVVTLYNVGFCQQAVGRYTQARRTLADALAESEATEGTSLPDALATAARVQLDEIASKLASAKVSMRVEDAKLLVDGRPLERAKANASERHAVFVAGTRESGPPEAVPAGEFSIELDPGTHVFQVIHSDRSEPQIVRTFAPGAVSAITFALPETKAAQAKRRWPTYLVLGVGAAGLATGATFGILSLEKRSELLGACPNEQCPEARQADISRFRTDTDITTGGLIVGIVGAVAGGILWFHPASVAPGEPSRAAPSARAMPWIGARSMGITGEF